MALLIVLALLVGITLGWLIATRLTHPRIARELGEYKAMVDSANDGMLLVENGRIVECNPAALRLHGVTRAELIGKSPAELSPQLQSDGRTSAEASADQIGEALSGKRQRFLWQHLRDHEVFTAEVALTPAVTLSDSGHPRFVAVIRDVTEAQTAAQALQDSEARFRKLFDLAPIPLALMDPQGQLLHTNQQWRHLIGYTQEDTPNLDAWWRLAYPDPAYRQHIQAAWDAGLRNIRETDGELNPSEVRVCCKDGVTRDLIAGGAIVGGNILTSFYDITERQAAQNALKTLNATLEDKVQERTCELERAIQDLKQTQDELVRSEKLASLGSLVAGVAHELNTPIGNAVIVASTQADLVRQFERDLAEGLKKSTLNRFTNDIREATDVMERNLRRAAELITGFKQVAVDQSSYQRRPFDLADVLHELHLTLSPTLKRAGVDLKVDCDAALLMDSYPGPLTQVLMNLINNAVAHAFEQHPDPQIEVTAQAGMQGHIQIFVQDNGCGIPAEHRSKVFDPFFTTKMGRGGSGLGLHIVYTLVTDLLGGTIRLASEYGTGTRFLIDLPLNAPHSKN